MYIQTKATVINLLEPFFLGSLYDRDVSVLGF